MGPMRYDLGARLSLSNWPRYSPVHPSVWTFGLAQDGPPTEWGILRWACLDIDTYEPHETVEDEDACSPQVLNDRSPEFRMTLPTRSDVVSSSPIDAASVSHCAFTAGVLAF